MALFLFSGWLKAMSRRSGAPRRGQRRPGRRCVPRLEALENRLAPAVLTVNTLTDQVTANNVLSLREAVGVVNSGSTSGLSTAERAQVSGTLGSNDTIQFSLPTGPQTITLTGGALSLTRNVTITGPGAANLTLSGNHANRAFRVFAGLTVTLSGLTIADGSAVS